MSERGLDANIVFIFPPEVDPAQLQHFFTRPGVTIIKILEGTVRGRKIVPLVRYEPPPGVRRSARVAAIPKKEIRGNWIVAAKVHYPTPLIQIRQDIDKYFGKSVKLRNFTDYNSILPSVTDITVNVKPVSPSFAPTMINVTDDDDGLGELASLFQGSVAVGGRKKKTRRLTKRSRKTTKRYRRH